MVGVWGVEFGVCLGLGWVGLGEIGVCKGCKVIWGMSWYMCVRFGVCRCCVCRCVCVFCVGV